VITGDNGALLVSEDGGKTWTPKNSQTDSMLSPARFSPDGIGVITGSNGTLLVSEDGGKTWTPQNSQTESGFYDAVFSPDGVGVISGDKGALLVSEDGGKTWILQNSQTDSDFNHPVFSPEGVGVITGKNGDLLVSKRIKPTTQEDIIKQLKGTVHNSLGDRLAEALIQKEISEETLKLANTAKSASQDNIAEKYVVRASVIAIILFLVQVLVTNYRYSRKLAAFYSARAQALSVYRELSESGGTNTPDLSVLMATLTPETDFGKHSQNNIESVVALAQKMGRTNQHS
jgi:citrate lyase gamma subunit